MVITRSDDDDPVWPALPYAQWKPTLTTLHMWMQVIGKVKLELTPFLNEWWNVTSALTARGMTTGTIPFGQRMFQVDFDFIDHHLTISVSDGRSMTMRLVACSVAEFYYEFMRNLEALGIQVRINTHPVEVENGIPRPSSRSAVGSVTPASQSCTERRLTPARAARSRWVRPVRPRSRRSRLRKDPGVRDVSMAARAATYHTILASRNAWVRPLAYARGLGRRSGPEQVHGHVRSEQPRSSIRTCSSRPSRSPRRWLDDDPDALLPNIGCPTLLLQADPLGPLQDGVMRIRTLSSACASYRTHAMFDSTALATH
jgi:hypothetical protein